MELKDRLNPKKNPFFEHGEGTIFCAYRNGYCVGRVTAQIDREHLERYQDDTGFFGFLDTIDDEEVARELLATRGGLAARQGDEDRARAALAQHQRGDSAAWSTASTPLRTS